MEQLQGKVDRDFALLEIDWRSRKTQTVAQWFVEHCKTRWIYHLHGLLRSLLGDFLSRQLWGQLPTWLECSGECKYVQDQLFYTFLSGDSPACASPRVHYKTRLHLLNGKSSVALWFFGFCQRVSHRGSLFAKYFSRQATGQREFPGQAIITDWLLSSLSLTPPGWFFVALSLKTKYFSPLVVVFSWGSPDFNARWFSRPLLPK